MITRAEVLMGRDTLYPLTPELENNLAILLFALNRFRKAYGKPLIVSSGYRPPEINKGVAGAAKRSNHMLCLACDFKDADGSLAKFCLDNLELLKELGLYLEHPSATKGWVHLQAVAPKSGNRVFYP